jgi:hypothetical protein
MREKMPRLIPFGSQRSQQPPIACLLYPHRWQHAAHNHTGYLDLPTLNLAIHLVKGGKL